MSGPCPVCGPQNPPTVHTACHPGPGRWRLGCGHPLADHARSLVCRVCGVDCGVDCTRVFERPIVTRREPTLPGLAS